MCGLGCVNSNNHFLLRVECSRNMLWYVSSLKQSPIHWWQWSWKKCQALAFIIIDLTHGCQNQYSLVAYLVEKAFKRKTFLVLFFNFFRDSGSCSSLFLLVPIKVRFTAEKKRKQLFAYQREQAFSVVIFSNLQDALIMTSEMEKISPEKFPLQWFRDPIFSWPCFTVVLL